MIGHNFSKEFSLLIKPASYHCNLRCHYCFYLCKESIFPSANFMSEAVLEQMIKSFFKLKMRNYSFGWQGGEPTLLGLDFFKKVVSLQQKHGRAGTSVSNALQTNGILLDNDWCKFLAQYNFLVGLSLDGPEEIHNRNRKTLSGEGSHQEVIEGLETLKRNNVDFNILTLVSDANVGHPLIVYNYLKELGCNYHQYIECVDFDEDRNLMPYSITGVQWGEFLCAIFDEWFKHDRYTISIRLFDAILAKLVDGIANMCSIAENCCQYLVIEHNGDVYPCDFYVLPEWKLGNVLSGDLVDFWKSKKFSEFGKRKQMLNAKCLSCEYLNLCAGCCPKNRCGRLDDPTRLSVLCDGWRLFFKHSLTRFRELAEEITERRALAELNRKRLAQTANFAKLPTTNNKRIGRNEPCPCGSGKKFKKCCGK